MSALEAAKQQIGEHINPFLTAAREPGLVIARTAEAIVGTVLEEVGVELNGSQPYDPQITDPRTCVQWLAKGVLGLGETFMEGSWNAAAPDEFMTRGLQSSKAWLLMANPPMIKAKARGRLFNPQRSTNAAKANVDHHYTDVGPEVYDPMLGPRDQYTCNYYGPDQDGLCATNLAEAEDAKLALVASKLYLHEPKSDGSPKTVFEAGCGWGGAAEYMAREFGVQVTAATLSAPQTERARQRTAGLPVTVLQQDARTVGGEYDVVMSVGMFEHIGPKNFRNTLEHFRNMQQKAGQLSLHHFIGGTDDSYSVNPFYEKYIFPGGVIPSLEQFTSATRGLYEKVDVQNLNQSYDRTLMDWYRNFMAARDALPQTPDNKYDEVFKRKWEFYLSSSAAGFRSGHLQLYQVVLRTSGSREIYVRPGFSRGSPQPTSFKKAA
jgi:cyclopropane-fatty-acyl-phospholipid synthase